MKSKSEGDNEDMPENFTLYAGKSPRKKKFVTHLDDYPKFIKLVKSPVLGRRREALLQQPLPPHLIPQPMSMSYPSSGSYHLIEQQPRFSNQQSPKVAYVNWAPQHRISNYNSYPNQDPRSNLFKSYSYDGYAQNLSHIPLVRRNSQYFIASSPQGYLGNDRNFYSRNTHDDRVLVGNRGGINSGRKFGPSQENSVPTSHQSAASSTKSTVSSSEFYYPREMDVETIERFRDENGRLIRLVKPIGPSTRIFNKANAPQMFMIVDQPSDYVTHSSPGRFVSDEREVDRISNRSFNSEGNSLGRSNNSEGNRSRRRTNNSEEYRSRRSNYSEERDNIPEADERNQEEVKEDEEEYEIDKVDGKDEIQKEVGYYEIDKEGKYEIDKEEGNYEIDEEERKHEIEKEEGKDEIEKEEGKVETQQEKEKEEEKPKEEEKEDEKSQEEEKEEEKPKKENSSKAKKESKRKKEEKRESLKEKKEKSEPEFKREHRTSYKDNIGMAQEVDVS